MADTGWLEFNSTVLGEYGTPWNNKDNALDGDDSDAEANVTLAGGALSTWLEL